MKSLKLIFSIAILAVIVLLTNCKKTDKETISTSQENEFIEPIFQIDDLNELENPDVAEADEAMEFKMRDSSKHNLLRPCERPFRHDDKNRRAVADAHGLPHVLKQLNLDSAQKRTVRGYLKDYCDCLADYHKKVHEKNREIMQKANRQRAEILKAYKDGKITKAQLADKLRALHKILKDDFGKDEHKKAHIASMKKCREGLFRNISTVLDSTQKDKFHRWVQNHK